jgi:hypothetical protein
MCNLYRQPSPDVPTTLLFIYLISFIAKYYKKSTNQKQELSVAAMFVPGTVLAKNEA